MWARPSRAAQVDEGAEAANVAHDALPHLSDLQLVQQHLAAARADLALGDALGQDQAIAAAVELDDLDVDLAANQFRQPRGQLILGLVAGAAAQAGEL